MKSRLFTIVPLLFSLCYISGEDKTVSLATLNWAPYIDETLENNGFVYEIVETVFKRSGYTIEVNFYPWARSVIVVESGSMDALFPEYYGEERLESFVFSAPFADGPVGLYKRVDLDVDWTVDPSKKQTEALRHLKEYKFGTVRGYINTEEFDNADFLNKEETTSDESNILKLKGKRIDFIFIDKFVAQHLINTKYPEYKDTLEFMEPPMDNNQFYLAFSKNSPDHLEKLDAFNRGLKIIRDDGTYDKILEKHGF